MISGRTLCVVAAVLLGFGSADECPSDWTTDPNGYCYKLSERVYNFNQANQYCIDNGGVLATLAGDGTTSGVRNMVTKDSLPPFMGLYKNDKGKWVYADGEPFLTLGWAKDEPSDYGNCTVFRNANIVTSGLVATQCYNLQPALCRQKIALCNGGNFGGPNIASGNFTSPGFPDAYYNNLNCYYYITAPENTYIGIDFGPFEVELNYDIVEVFDGNTTKTLLGTLTGTNPKTTSFESTTNQMLVIFTTDSANTKKGWAANWNAVNRQPPIVVSGSSGDLSSPNYPSNYPPYLEQTYSITTTAGFVVSATFDAFKTEDGVDTLTVYDSGVLIGNYSGTLKPGPKFLSTTNNVTMKFVTDGVNQYAGWHMNWVAI